MHDPPLEVLETSGCETFMGNKARRPHRHPLRSLGYLPHRCPGSPPRASPLSATKLTAEKAAELLQEALRALKSEDKLVKDKQEPAALERLHQACESTQNALGQRYVMGKA
ncbi:hypothetical protein KC356_g4770 [Hortaea werneckii]|nr:hypothetical protein KC356_g4770 [Hortaea werneckii]